MSIYYSLLHQTSGPYYVCQQASVKRAEKVCQCVPGGVVDQAISNLLLELMQPMTIQVALAVQQEVEARINETQALRRKHVERAQYEAELARRHILDQQTHDAFSFTRLHFRITEQQIKGGVHRTTYALEKAIKQYILFTNENPNPADWNAFGQK